MLLAEELEVIPEEVRLEHALPDKTRYANRFFGEQMTGASSSVRAFSEPPHRAAGATARTMRVAEAAAARWPLERRRGRCHAFCAPC
jgi:isoquinoline 1-oxidoreductase beta subunit